MPYDGKLLARARARLDTIRNENAAEQARRLSGAYMRIPELEELDRRMRSQMSQLTRLMFSKRPDTSECINALRDENLSCSMRKRELLTDAGYPSDYLEPVYSCSVCRDTGLDGGKVCRCLDRLYNEELTRELSALLRRGDESFENFDPSLYSDEYSPVYGGVPRRQIEVIFRICKKFADNFPAVGSNLLLSGGTGLGKTYLSACIARKVAERGYSVYYDSAASAFEAFERQKFSRNPDEAEQASATVRRMLDCDLLIIDDLGTELVTTVTTSALYTLINTRLTSRKAMVINTTFSPDELEKLYTAPICSRLAGEFLTVPFIGDDIRRSRN